MRGGAVISLVSSLKINPRASARRCLRHIVELLRPCVGSGGFMGSSGVGRCRALYCSSVYALWARSCKLSDSFMVFIIIQKSHTVMCGLLARLPSWGAGYVWLYSVIPQAVRKRVRSKLGLSCANSSARVSAIFWL